MRRQPTLPRMLVVVLARAVRPYVDSDRGPTRAALELARNVAQVLLVEPDLDAYAVAEEMVRHRMREGWLRCGDVRSVARLASDAWRSITGDERAAA